MTDSREYFVTEAIRHARSLSLRESILFLRGLLQSSLDSKGMESVRQAYIGLSESDRQLELIQTGQLRLDFESNETPTNGETGK